MHEQKKRLIQAINNPNVFFDNLIDLRDDNLLNSLCQELQKETEIDYFRMALEAIEKNQDIFLLAHVLEKIAYLSKLDIVNILSLYKILYEKMKNYLAGNSQYNISHNITLQHREFSTLLLDELYKINEEYTIHHISTILTALNNEHHISQYINIKAALVDMVISEYLNTKNRNT